MRKSKISSGVLLAMGGSLMLASLPALAQSTERVEVTGSHLKSLGVNTVSPVTVIDAKEIQADGVRNVEAFLNNLPQVFASQGASVVNGSTGTANVNLRGLGASRTLVLVNGRRMPMGSPNNVSADLNEIPAGLIRRVELLTGGASAVYGSDAVAGVVNFIMNDRFEGLQLDLNHSFFNHRQHNAAGVADLVQGLSATNPGQFKVPGNKGADGKSTNFSLLFGRNFDSGKGNATVYLNYKKDDALLLSERDFSACLLAAPGTATDAFSCGGSGSNATGRITNTNIPLLDGKGLLNVGGKLNGGKVFTSADALGNARAYSSASDQFNLSPLSYFQRPSERIGLNAYGHYDVGPKAKVYLEFGFHDDQTVAQFAPGGALGGVYTVRYDNPLLSPSWRAALDLNAPGDSTQVVMQRRNVEGGGLQSEFRNKSFRSVLGLNGNAGPWSYDVYAIEAKVSYNQSERNDFLTPRIANAMDVVNVGGVAKCASGEAGCVPYNPWTLGGVTAAQLDYLQAPGLRKGSTSLSMQGASVAVDLGAFGIKSPMAKAGLSLSLGAEHRAEALVLITDSATANGDLSGSSGPVKGLTGDTSVKEVFGELRMPIIDKGLWPELLQATLSGRHAAYASGFTANTYGLGLEWAPVRETKFRTSLQHGVRAPNLVELFTVQGASLYGNDEDPCAGATPTRSLADCSRTGVTAAQYGTIQDSPTGQYNVLAGGNPKLKPETANSLTLGVVLTPLRSLNVTVDYFDIRVKDTIRNIDPTTTLSKCLDTGNSAFCSLISRDSQGSLWLLPQGTITSTNQNLGSTRTSGLDLAAAYSQKLGAKGEFGIHYAATLLRKLEVEEVKGDGEYDCAGLYGPNKCGAPSPKYRHKLRATWNTPWALEAALTWRHLSSVLLQTTSGNPLLSGSVPDKERELGAQNYLDVAASWKASRGLTLSVGINNLLDKDPPITSKLASGQGNGNTYPSVYDALGRKVFLTGSYTF